MLDLRDACAQLAVYQAKMLVDHHEAGSRHQHSRKSNVVALAMQGNLWTTSVTGRPVAVEG